MSNEKKNGCLGHIGDEQLPMLYSPKDPITERQRMIGVSNHLRNA